jgi:hypothetical protein
MRRSSGKPIKKKVVPPKKDEPSTLPVDKKTFLAGVKKIAPTYVEGYVCLF